MSTSFFPQIVMFKTIPSKNKLSENHNLLNITQDFRHILLSVLLCVNLFCRAMKNLNRNAAGMERCFNPEIKPLCNDYFPKP